MQHTTVSAFPDIRTMQEARDLVFSNTDYFEKTCVNRKINFALRPHYGDQSYNIKEGVRATLRKIECPMVAMPDNLKTLMPTDLFVFDGAADAMLSIKTFTYLFPQRRNQEILIDGSLARFR